MEVESAALTVHAHVYSPPGIFVTFNYAVSMLVCFLFLLKSTFDFFTYVLEKKQRELRFDGDFFLRDNFHKNMLEILNEQSSGKYNSYAPRNILDLGCSTGLSTLKLHSTFPSAKITGLDLSPYFLAGTICFILFTRNVFLRIFYRITYSI